MGGAGVCEEQVDDKCTFAYCMEQVRRVKECVLYQSADGGVWGVRWELRRALGSLGVQV